MLKKIIIGAVCLVLAIVGLGFVFNTANADTGDQPCVPSDAWTQTIDHPAVTHVVHHGAVTHDVTVVDQEATPDVWANFSPNRDQGPFDGPPSYPTDDRGTWQNHDQIPGGHEGPDGVYQRDNPNSGRADWFYRHNATPEVNHVETVVDQEAFDETVVDHEAYTETIDHPAVTCTPDQPAPLVSTDSSILYICGNNYQIVTTVTTTTEYVLVDGAWVLGDPTSVTTTDSQPAEVVPCPFGYLPPNWTPPHHNTPNDPTPHSAPPVKHSSPAPVPTVIDAGL